MVQLIYLWLYSSIEIVIVIVIMLNNTILYNSMILGLRYSSISKKKVYDTLVHWARTVLLSTVKKKEEENTVQ